MNPTQSANNIALPHVKKKEVALVKSISELSINAQLQFQASETSELLLTEMRCLAKTTTDNATNVIEIFLNLQFATDPLSNFFLVILVLQTYIFKKFL